MFPVALDVQALPIALIGSGKAVKKRLVQLDEAKAGAVTLYAPDADAELKNLAGTRLISRLPNEADLQGKKLVLIADMDDKTAFAIADLGRKLGAWVNVEDRKEYCDFYYPSLIRRGDLLISVNTGGYSPALAVRIRKYLERLFPAVWAERLQEIGRKRDEWRGQGLSMTQVADKTNEYIDEREWL